MAKAPHILVVDDDPVLREMIKDVLETDGYQCTLAGDGTSALKLLTTVVPDLILLDVMMPGVDGREVCRTLKSNPMLSFIPIIMLTALGGAEHTVRGLELGADDYLAKPFYLEELLARVKAQLRRSRVSNANPLTGLPGNIVIEAQINARLARTQADMAMMYCDLDHFKAFNDVYGFARGDEVIKFTGRVLSEAVENSGHPDDFVGQIGGDDFVVLTTMDRAEPIAKRIIEEFDRGVLSFYSAEDRQRGYTTLIDRRGQPERYPLLSISIGVVLPTRRGIGSYLEASQIATEAKQVSKSMPGSSYFIDRRAKKGDE